jgi:putative ABC transport system permease protein
MREVRQAVHVLSTAPLLSLTIVATLAIGIAVNTAVFTVADALLFRALPYAHPNRLVMIAGGLAGADDLTVVSEPFFTLVRDRTRTLSTVGICVFENFNLTKRGDPEQVNAARASANFFDVLGVLPAAGRGFQQQDDQQGAPQVVILSYEFATRLFGGPPAALGQTVTLDSSDYIVVGVLPKSFVFTLFGPRREIWTTRVIDFSLVTQARVARGGPYFNVIGRLRDGVSRDQAGAEAAALYRQYAQEKPGNVDASMNLNVHAVNLQDELVSGIRPTLLILWAAVVLVLLIASANAGSLLLSRALARRREFAIRLALGAATWTVVRQLLVESLLLALFSGVAGIALAALGVHALTALNPDTLRAADLSVSGRVLAFTLAISIGSALLFGLAPAIQVLRVDVMPALRDEGRGFAGGRRGNRSRSVMVIAQVALSMVMLIASALLLRSFVAIRDESQGFDPTRTLTMHVTLPRSRYATPEDRIAFYHRVLDRLRVVPGVTASTISTALPPAPNHLAPVLFEGQPEVAVGKRPLANLIQVSPDYLALSRIPLLSGRMFDEHDDADAPQVVIVNQLIARRYWPKQGAIGRRLWIGGLPKPYQVVGVIGDTRNHGPASPPQIEVVLPFPQMPQNALVVSVRTATQPYGVAGEVRKALATADADLPVTEVQSMEALLDSVNAGRRFTLVLIATLSAAAFVLAVVGIYGVIAYTTAQRSQEIGIRMALGAGHRDIFRLVLTRGLLLTLAGIVIGIVGSLAATRLISSMLYATSTHDPASYVASASVFVTAALLASYLPARRAARINPSDALRTE